MKWIRYTIETTTAAEDLIADALAQLGIEGVEVEDNLPLTREDTAKMFIDIMPEIPDDDGSARVSFYLEAGEGHEEILSRVREAIEEVRGFVDAGPGTISASGTDDADWLDNWKDFFHSFVIEGEGEGPGILIKPTWEPLTEPRGDRILIEIDPGVSFGTGKHETTQLCIRRLSEHVKEGDEVLDLGCGSGILSIVSLKLGAAHVVGTDIDGDCIVSTGKNFAVNGLDEGLGEFYVGDLIEDVELRGRVGTGRFDIVVANILAEVIIPMAPIAFDRLKPGGVFMASGIIDSRDEAALAAIEAAGFEILKVNREGEWVGITARRPL